jgi:hypothetical protein
MVRPQANACWDKILSKMAPRGGDALLGRVVSDLPAHASIASGVSRLLVAHLPGTHHHGQHCNDGPSFTSQLLARPARPPDSHPPGRLGSRSCHQLTHSEPVGPAVHFLIGTQSLSEGVSCAALLNASRKPFVGEVALLPIQLEELTDRDLLFFLFLDRERPLASTIMPSDLGSRVSKSGWDQSQTIDRRSTQPANRRMPVGLLLSYPEPLSCLKDLV